MNEANLIDRNSLLFGFLGEEAQKNRFSAVFNQQAKALGENAMCIPMNIRRDDFYFTVSGLRKAQLRGVIVAPEYRHEVLELLDAAGSGVEACGYCDAVRVEAGKLYGGIVIAEALGVLLREKRVKSLAILGSGALAKSVLMHLKEAGVEKVTLFDERVESCMELLQGLGGVLEGIATDIERACGDMPVDFGGFDAALNASELMQPDLSDVLTAAPLMIDLGSSQTLFKTAAAQTYMGYDDILPYYTRTAYEFWKKTTQESEDESA